MVTFVYLFVTWTLGCLYLLATVNNAAMTICVHYLCRHMFLFLLGVPRSRITGSYDLEHILISKTFCLFVFLNCHVGD
jgi:hypothetical protein